MDEMVDAGKTVVNDYLNDDWNGAVHDDWRNYSDQKVGDDLKLYKTVLTTAKSSSSSTRNTLWLIYSVTLSDNTMEPTVYYFAVTQQNIAVNNAGKIFHSNAKFYKYPGSTSYEELKEDYIVSYNLNVIESAN